MVDIEAFPYLCFVRFDLVHKEFDREFNRHFDAHIQELADRPGYSTAWRTRELRGNDNAGVLEQEYQQIYAIADPALFKSFPQDPPPPVPESEPWRRDLSNWGRVFYRVLSLAEKDARAGRCWARCEFNIRGTDAEHARFQSTGAQHLRAAVDALPGVHRGWQLRHAIHPAQIGADPVGTYMHLYELDAPENLFDPSLGADRIALAAGQELAGRHFARLLLKAEPRR
jgi:hypothetical protein